MLSVEEYCQLEQSFGTEGVAQEDLPRLCCTYTSTKIEKKNLLD